MLSIAFDFFEMSDEELNHELYSKYITPASSLGTLDEYEMGALSQFFASCAQFGLDTPQYVFKIESRSLPTIHAHLLNWRMPDNLWHRELKERLLAMLERPLKQGKGVLAIG